MGAAVQLPVQFGAAKYIVAEQGDSYGCREVGVVAKGAGKLPAGTVMARLLADAGDQKAGELVGWQAGNANLGPASFILYEDTDARLVKVKRTFTARTTQVQRSALTFVGAPTDSQKNTAYAALAANMITMR